MKLKEARESERLLRKAAQELNVPVKTVPAAVKNLMDDINSLEARIKAMEGK